MTPSFENRLERVDRAVLKPLVSRALQADVDNEVWPFDRWVGDPAIKLPNAARRIANLPPGREPPRILGPGLEQSVALYRYLLQMGEEALDLSAKLV